jgi:hypothetical protein
MAKRLVSVVLLLALGVAVGLAVAASVERHQTNEAQRVAFDRLRLFHDLRRAALED